MTFLGIGPGELLMIVILTLVVVGPERLPGMARQAGRLLVTVRNWMQTSPDAALVLRARQEIEQELAQLRVNLLEVQNVRDEVMGVAKQIDEAVSPITQVRLPSAADLLKPPSEPVVAAGATSTPPAPAEEPEASQALVDPTGAPLAETIPAETTSVETTPAEELHPSIAPAIESTSDQGSVRNGTSPADGIHNGTAHLPAAAEIEALGLRLQAVMADLFALQEQLKQRGLLADDWSPPSHSMQLPQPDTPIEEANR